MRVFRCLMVAAAFSLQQLSTCRKKTMGSSIVGESAERCKLITSTCDWLKAESSCQMTTAPFCCTQQTKQIVVFFPHFSLCFYSSCSVQFLQCPSLSALVLPFILFIHPILPLCSCSYLFLSSCLQSLTCLVWFMSQKLVCFLFYFHLLSLPVFL